MENLLVQFRENCLSDLVEFEMENGGKKLFFVKKKSGKATLVFGCYTYHQKTVSMDSTFKLQAIVTAEGIVNVVDTFTFYPFFNGDNELPSGVVDFDSTLETYNHTLSDISFASFYQSLPTVELTENEIATITTDVKRKVLNGQTIEKPSIGSVIKAEKVFDLICGYQSYEDFKNTYFEHIKDNFIKRKSVYIESMKQFEALQSVGGWELELSKALNNIEAKKVNVEFTFNGNVTTAKMDRERLIRKFANNDYFSDFDFETRNEGKKVLGFLGADDWRHGEREVLEAKHISKITYSRKEIYVKK